MKKKIAIMLTLILATGTFTACTAEEKCITVLYHPRFQLPWVFLHLRKVLKWQQPKQQPTPKNHSFKRNRAFGTECQNRRKADSEQNSAVVSATAPIQKTQSEVRNISKNTANSNKQKLESTAKKKLKILLKSLLKSQRKSLCRSLRKANAETNGYFATAFQSKNG